MLRISRMPVEQFRCRDAGAQFERFLRKLGSAAINLRHQILHTERAFAKSAQVELQKLRFANRW